jgi:FHS family L-fucose permease-like MFS transporter
MTHSSLPASPETEPASLTERRFLLPFLLVISLFFLWAFGVNLNDILIPHL